MPARQPRTLAVHLTTQSGDNRLSPKKPVRFDPTDTESENEIVNIHEDVRYQKVVGFGGAFTEAAAVTFYGLPAAARRRVMDLYFSPTRGHGYTLCRTTINSCDFSTGNYAYVEDPGDTRLDTFSVARDKEALIPMILEAQKTAKTPIKLFASPWSPPAWMKSNGAMNGGGKLKPRYRRLWAEYIARYCRTYAREGVRLWGLTVQNEPKATQTWDSCVFTAAEERDFVREHLGPVLTEKGLGGLKLFVWDHNKERVFERATVILSDPKAAKYVTGVGFHWYSGDHFEALDLCHERYPDKPLLFTEGCTGPETVDTWVAGERYAHEILGDLNHWAVGWTDWNLLLDGKGGPNHVGNFCAAPIMADTRTGEIRPQSSYYYMGHFARFIPPGSVRVGHSRFTEALEVTAFRRPDRQVSVVVLNRGDRAIAFKLRTRYGTAPCVSPAHSIMTLVY